MSHMCRLLGILGSVECWKEILHEFQELSEKGKILRLPNILPGHLDGWGVAALKSDNSGMELTGKFLGNAMTAPEYDSIVHSFAFQPRVLLYHLRKASPKIRVSLPNSQPFLSSSWAFIHNGTVYNAENLTQSKQYQITSDNSDSEFFFHYLLTDLIEEKNTDSKVRKLIKNLTRIDVQYSALNSIMSNGQELYAVRCAAEHQDYYSLFYYKSKLGVTICSEKLDLGGIKDSSWSEIPNHSILSIIGTPPQIKLTGF